MYVVKSVAPILHLVAAEAEESLAMVASHGYEVGWDTTQSLVVLPQVKVRVSGEASYPLWKMIKGSSVTP